MIALLPNYVLNIAPQKLREVVGDNDLPDVVAHLVEGNTPEDLALMYLEALEKFNRKSLDEVVDEALRMTDVQLGEEPL